MEFVVLVILGVMREGDLPYELLMSLISPTDNSPPPKKGTHSFMYLSSLSSVVVLNLSCLVVSFLLHVLNTPGLHWKM